MSLSVSRYMEESECIDFCTVNKHVEVCAVNRREKEQEFYRSSGAEMTMFLYILF